jgi:hypothetical protein
MDTRFYQSQGLDIERLAFELEHMFITQGYQVQHFGDQRHMVIQLKQGGDFAALVGMQAALTLTLHASPGGMMAVLGQQRWADKAAAGAVGMFIMWPLAFTAGAGMIRQSNLASQVLTALDALVRQQQANVQIGPVPAHLLQQVQQQQQVAPSLPQQPMPASYQSSPQVGSSAGQIPPPPPGQAFSSPAPVKIPCPDCRTPHDPGDLYCARCGASLTPAQKTSCPQCGAEVKQDAAFCTKCGLSFSQPARTTEATKVEEMTPKTQLVTPAAGTQTWGNLIFTNGQQIPLTGTRMTVGRVAPHTSEKKPDINLYAWPEASTVSRQHAVIEYVNDRCTLTDLKSTNLTLLNEQALTPDTPTTLTDGDTIHFGKLGCTFRKA